MKFCDELNSFYNRTTLPSCSSLSAWDKIKGIFLDFAKQHKDNPELIYLTYEIKNDGTITSHICDKTIPNTLTCEEIVSCEDIAKYHGLRVDEISADETDDGIRTIYFFFTPSNAKPEVL